MSQSKNRTQAERWLQTAQVLLNEKMYAQACFIVKDDAERGLNAARKLLTACNVWLNQHWGER